MLRWVVVMVLMLVVLLVDKMGAHLAYLRDNWLADTRVQPLGSSSVVATELLKVKTSVDLMDT